MIKTPAQRASDMVQEAAKRGYLWSQDDPLRQELLDIFARHISEAVAQELACPLPAPESEEWLSSLEEWLDKEYPTTRFGDRTWPDHIRRLLRHIRHLTALIRDVAQDPSSAILLDHGERMRRMGHKEMRLAVVGMLGKRILLVEGDSLVKAMAEIKLY